MKRGKSRTHRDVALRWETWRWLLNLVVWGPGACLVAQHWRCCSEDHNETDMPLNGASEETNQAVILYTQNKLVGGIGQGFECWTYKDGSADHILRVESRINREEPTANKRNARKSTLCPEWVSYYGEHDSSRLFGRGKRVDNMKTPHLKHLYPVRRTPGPRTVQGIKVFTFLVCGCVTEGRKKWKKK